MTKLTYDDGRTRKTNTYDNRGNKKETRDGNNRLIEDGAALRDNRVYEEKISGGGRRTYRYDNEGRVVERFSFRAISGGQLIEKEFYTWDHRGRLVKIHRDQTWNYVFSTPRVITDVQYFYDALDRPVGRIVTVRNEQGAVTNQESVAYVYDATGLAMELNTLDSGRIYRNYLRGPGQAGVLAVDQADPAALNSENPPSSILPTITAWAFADMAGTVATVAWVERVTNTTETWHLHQRVFDELGNVTQKSPDHADRRLTSAPTLWRGLRFDELAGVYLAGTTAVSPLTGRYLSQAAHGDSNPYRFARNQTTDQTPTQVTVHGDGEPGYAYWVNPVNDFRAGRYGWGIAKSVSWLVGAVAGAAAAVEAGAVGAIGALASKVTVTGAATYLGTQAGISVLETSVEVGIASVMGTNYDWAAGFGKNFVVNTLTGGIGTEMKWGGKFGALALRQGIEIAGDTVIDVRVYGNDLSSSLVWNTVGSIGGEALFKGVARTWRAGRNALGSVNAPTGGAWTRAYQRGEIAVDPNKIRFTQRKAGGGTPPRTHRLRESLSQGWDPDAKDAAINVIETPDGLLSLDNTRVAIAQEKGLLHITARVRQADELIPADFPARQLKFFQGVARRLKMDSPRTWGDLFEIRLRDSKLPSSGTPTRPRLKE